MIYNWIQSFSGPFSEALGWTIVHSLWQGAILAIVMTITHSLMHKKSAKARYNVSILTLGFMLLSSIITFFFYYNSSPGESTLFVQNNLMIAASESGNTSLFSLASLSTFIQENIAWIITIWAIGALVFFLRFTISLGYVTYLKKSTLANVEPKLSTIFQTSYQKMALKKSVQIKESLRITVPMVIGYIKPIILFPVGLVNVLAIDEVEAIILHELAHIKRNDFLINLILTLIEAIYYYHPAIWWISANIRTEREHACDDIAIHKTNAIKYAKALVKIEEMRQTLTPSLAMPLFKNKHQLLNRINRILNMKQTRNDMKIKSITTGLLFGLVLLISIQGSTITAQENTPIIEKEEIEKIKEVEKIREVEKIKEIEEVVVIEEVEEIEEMEMEKEIREIEIEHEKEFRSKKNEIEKELREIQEDIERITNRKVFMERRHMDTLPRNKSESKMRFSRIDDDKKVEIEMKNGEVTSLKIDGKVIPKSEYDQYEDLMPISLGNGAYGIFDGDNHFDFDFDNNFDSVFSNSFGLMFDGNNWNGFDKDFNGLFDGNKIIIEKNMDQIKGLENLLEDSFITLDELQGLENMPNLDSLLKDGLHNSFIFDDLDDRVTVFPDGFGERGQPLMVPRGGSTVVDVIGSRLNDDGLLTPFKSNKIEISGKHLKINGEKMPKAIFEKYKRIYQEKTGAPLTKKSKMVFEVEGKNSKRRVRVF